MLHEKLICYRRALALAEELGKSLAQWPRGYGYLADQIRRAIASVVLNCAEGNAKQSPMERRRFFQISRASLSEVGACLDLMIAFQLASQSQMQNWKRSVDDISKMLYALR
jgi:four helix bundle protein